MNIILIKEEDWLNLNQKLDVMQKQLSQLASAHQPDTIIDEKKFQEMLGISSKTAFNIRSRGEISYSKVGKSIYYSMKDVNEFLEKRKQKAFKK